MKRRAKPLEPKTELKLEIHLVEPPSAAEKQFEEHLEWVDRQLALLILGPELAARIGLATH